MSVDKYYLSNTLSGTNWSLTGDTPELWYKHYWRPLNYKHYDRYAYRPSAAVRIQQSLAKQGIKVWVLTEEEVLAILAKQ